MIATASTRQFTTQNGAAAQLLSPRALLRGVAKEGLTNRVGCAKVTGMKTRTSTGGAAAGVTQLVPSAVLLNGVAGEWSASGVRCASVAGMNRRANMKSRGGGGHYCLAWLCETADRVAWSLVSSGGGRKACFEVADGLRDESLSGVRLTRSVSLAYACRGFAGGLISDLRARSLLRFSSTSAPAFGIAFGGCLLCACC